MKNTKFYKAICIGIIILAVVLSLINIIKIVAPSSGILLSTTELNKIKDTINSYSEDYNSFKFHSVKGNKRYLAVTFASTTYENEYKKISILYDTKKNKVITSLEEDYITINLLDTTLIEYVNDNIFLVLDSFGNLYRVNTQSENFKIKLISETGINNNSFFKYFYKDNSLYIITRDKLSKYNEKTLSNNVVLEIKFKNNNFKKADFITYKFNESDFLYSFVLDEKGNVGVLGSDIIEVLGETANSLILPTDESYLKEVPSSNKYYKFIDTSSIWVRFFNDDSTIQIKEDLLNLKYRAIHSLVNKKLDINISSPSNIPIILGKDFTLFSEFNYEDFLQDASFVTVTDLIKVYSESGEEKESISTIRSDLHWFNYKPKKYIGFIPSKDKILGIKKDGSIDEVLDFSFAYIYDKTAIYLDNNTIKFKKI